MQPLAIVFLTFLATILFLTVLYAFFTRNQTEQWVEEEIFQDSVKINVEYLADSLKELETEKLALLLSYLSREKAKRLLHALPKEMQEEVLSFLAEVKKDQKR